MAAGRTALECVLADVAAVAGEDAEVLRRDAPPAADGAAERGHGSSSLYIFCFFRCFLWLNENIVRTWPGVARLKSTPVDNYFLHHLPCVDRVEGQGVCGQCRVDGKA